MHTSRDQSTESAILITRTFDAPRELVFKAFIEPERMMRWWGPKDYTTPYCRIDARPGGATHCCMRSPEGKDYWSIGTYREVVAPERIVVTDSFSDPEGNVVPASYYDMGDEWPLEMLITLEFEEEDGGTKLTIRHEGIPAGEDSEMCGMGWSESFDKLDEYLAEEQE